MTWNTALIFSYGLPVEGRDAKAMEAFADAQVFFGKMAADGMCAEPEVFHPGFGGGMMIVRAESYEKLFDMLEMEEAKRIITVCMFAVHDFKYSYMTTGDLLMENMGFFAKVGVDLGYL
ncbi:MAG: hypothetical protein GY953_32140 [bacterium]|nr:hypothetical protein [bacterium]